MPLGPNLLPDLPNSSTFETGTSEWTVAGSSVTKTQDSTSAYAGTYSMRVHGNATYGYVYRMTSGLTVGRKYRFGGWFRKPAADGTSKVYISLQPNGSGEITLTDTWTEHWVEITSAGSTTLETKIWVPVNGHNVLCDELYVSEVLVEPEGYLDIPITVEGMLFTDVPAIFGSADIPITIEGELTMPDSMEGSMDAPVTIEGSLSYLVPLPAAELDIPISVVGGLAVGLSIPSRPLPAPPEELGVFPMPIAGGVLTQALHGKNIDMDAPTIVDGTPT